MAQLTFYPLNCAKFLPNDQTHECGICKKLIPLGTIAFGHIEKKVAHVFHSTCLINLIKFHYIHGNHLILCPHLFCTKFMIKLPFKEDIADNIRRIKIFTSAIDYP